MGSEKFLMQFGIKIRELRIKRGWARKDLARHSGLSAVLISSIEKGQVDISLRIILQLMEGLGYTDDELLTSNI